MNYAYSSVLYEHEIIWERGRIKEIVSFFFPQLSVRAQKDIMKVFHRQQYRSKVNVEQIANGCYVRN